MNAPLSNKTLIVLTLAIVATTGSISRAQDQSMPPPASGAALPPEIVPNSPLAQVVKLVQAGTDVSLIENFVSNAQDPFNVDADMILTLNDLGVPKDVINAMLNRDKVLYAANNTPPPPVAQPAPDTAVDTAPPATPVTAGYFDDTLTPYGSWVVVEGYGRCWRPTVVNYDSGWRPYCDRGHWVSTDCGWYWDSDYSWGVTFHYGRWLHHAHYGWCWAPDTTWGPSWVTWRSSGDYCGWAPLPPLTVYQPGGGFFYRGASVAVDFDFGLSVDCFTFVTPDRFCDPHPRRFCVDSGHAPDVFRRTTVVNNYSHTTINVGGRHDNVFVNNGISIAQINAHAHAPIQTVHVSSLPDARREGWRGGVTVQQDNRYEGANHNNPVRNPSSGNNQTYQNYHTTVIHGNASNGNNQDNHTTVTHGNGTSFSSGANHPVSGTVYTPRQQATEPPVNRNSPYNRSPQNNNVTVDNNNNPFHPTTQPRENTSVTPAAPEHVPQVPQRQAEPPRQVEQPSHVESQQHETVQHSSPPAAAPAQSQQRNEDRGDRNSDKDPNQKNH